MLKFQALIPKIIAGKPGIRSTGLDLTVAAEGNIPGSVFQRLGGAAGSGSLGTGIEQFQPFQPHPLGGNSLIPASIPNLSSPLQTAPGNSWIHQDVNPSIGVIPENSTFFQVSSNPGDIYGQVKASMEKSSFSQHPE